MVGKKNVVEEEGRRGGGGVESEGHEDEGKEKYEI